MSLGYKEIISAYIQTGDTITNTTTKTGFATLLNMPATTTGTAANATSEFRWGQAFDVDLYGLISTAASPGTLTMTIDHGSNGVAAANLTALGSTGAITPTASLSGAYWKLKGRTIWNATGSAGIATFSGDFTIVSANVPLVYPMISTGTSGTTGMATGLNTYQFYINSLQCSAQWSNASTSNSITLAAGSKFERVA